MKARYRQRIRLLLMIMLLVGAVAVLRKAIDDPGQLAGDAAAPLTIGAVRKADKQPWKVAGANPASHVMAGEVDGPSTPPLASPAPVATRYFDPDSYAMGRMQIFGRFWRNAEEQWNAADFQLAERDAALLDGRQSYQVYVYLRTCLDAPRSPAEAERRLGQLESAVAATPSLRNARRLEWMFQQLEQGLARCDGLPEELEPLALKWLTRAATRGYPLAQIAYYRSYRWLASRKPYLLFGDYDGISRYRRRAADFLSAALHSGHAEAFVEMGLALAEGVVFETDVTSAYAHALAAQRAAGPDLDLSAELRARLKPDLGGDQIREASRMAEVLCERYCL